MLPVHFRLRIDYNNAHICLIRLSNFQRQISALISVGKVDTLRKLPVQLLIPHGIILANEVLQTILLL